MGCQWLLVGEADVDAFWPLFLIFFLFEICGGGDDICLLGAHRRDTWWRIVGFELLAFRGRIFFVPECHDGVARHHDRYFVVGRLTRGILKGSLVPFWFVPFSFSFFFFFFSFLIIILNLFFNSYTMYVENVTFHATILG